MKKLLLSTVALVGFAGVASAADLPRRAVAPVAPFVPAFTWTGFYFGVNAGAGFGVNDDDDDDDLFGTSESIRINRGSIRGSQGSAGRLRLNGGEGLFGNDDDSDVGFTGGGQIGFNYQFTPGSGFVVGLEADIQYIDIGGGGTEGDNTSRNFTFDADVPAFGGVPRNSFGAAFDPRGTRVNPATGQFGGPALRVVREGNSASTLDYFGTARGRLGYAFDRTLIYATGGFAYGDGNEDFRYGYTVGGGVEFAFNNFQLFGSSAVTFKIEGLYVNLSESDDDNGGDVRRASYSRTSRTLRLPAAFDDGDELEFAVVRAGVNFKF